MDKLRLVDLLYLFAGLMVVLAIFVRDMFIDWGRAVIQRYFVMSSDGFQRVDTSTVPPIPEVVPALSNAAHTGIEPKSDQLITPSISHNMKRLELIVVLAVQKSDGKYVFSANKIAELFAGTDLRVSRNKILEEIDEIRNGKKSIVANGHEVRPQNGW